MNPPKMPIHVGDYMRDTGHLRAAGHGAYLMLLFHYWSTGSLPDDDEQLSAIARMSSAEWKKAKPVIEKFFKPGWHHGRVEEDLEAAKQSYEKRAKAGAQGGKAKAEGKQSSSNATAPPEQCSTYLIPLTKEEKKDAAEAASIGAEADYFRRVKDICGPSAGGLAKKLLTAKDGNIALARAAAEQASTKENPREYLGGVIRNRGSPEDERMARRSF